MTAAEALREAARRIEQAGSGPICPDKALPENRAAAQLRADGALMANRRSAAMLRAMAERL